MSKVQSWLTGFLMLQVAIVVAVFYADQPSEADSSQAPLVDVEWSTVNRVVVSDGSSSATLQKTDGEWIMPAFGNLPVEKSKVSSMLDKVAALSTGWPVATSQSSHARFDVAVDKFQRRLQFYQGEDVSAELLLGTSPGFRKVHIRPIGNDAVYTVQLNTHDIPAEADDWLEKTLLSVDAIDYIKGPDYTLKMENDQWRFVGNTQNNLQLNTEKAQQLSSALTELRVQSVSTDAIGDSAMTLQVSGASGKWDYQFFQSGDKYLVSRTDRSEVFAISQNDYERIAQIGLPQLVVDTAKPSDEADTATASSNS
jgi:Domain of unknown function (DUF4340)